MFLNRTCPQALVLGVDSLVLLPAASSWLLIIADSPRLLDEASWTELRANPIAKTILRVKGSHYQEWIDGIKTNTPCGSNFDYGGALSEIAVLGALAMQSGKSFEWDSAKMDITSHPELNPILRHTPREGWDYR